MFAPIEGMQIHAQIRDHQIRFISSLLTFTHWLGSLFSYSDCRPGRDDVSGSYIMAAGPTSIVASAVLATRVDMRFIEP
jgi:hypothetical protein